MDTLSRFSNRVENYVKYRPDYPHELIVYLQEKEILRPDTVIADIGSGTGISAELFLKEGNIVYGVEPNKEMREAAERLLASYSRFKSISAKAEQTTLESNSIDLIIAGQAFHWFDKQKCKTEFQRILKPNGVVLLMWNDRKTDSTDFLKNYEDFIKMFATDYLEVNHKNIEEEVFVKFFGIGKYKEASFNNFQHVNFEGLKGRVLSSSYMPDENHKDYEHMIYVLKKLFSRYQENGKVSIDYDTRIYYGQLNKANL